MRILLVLLIVGAKAFSYPSFLILDEKRIKQCKIEKEQTYQQCLLEVQASNADQAKKESLHDSCQKVANYVQDSCKM